MLWLDFLWPILMIHGEIQVTNGTPDGDGKKVAAGICGILLGSLGIHKFVLGYSTEGLIMLLVTILTCGLGGLVMGIIGLIEGIIYLTKTDAEFYSTYIAGKKGWF
jgi:TM2 domain-containing membrane protein YozV